MTTLLNALVTCVVGDGYPYVKVQFKDLADAQRFHASLAAGGEAKPVSVKRVERQPLNSDEAEHLDLVEDGVKARLAERDAPQAHVVALEWQPPTTKTNGCWIAETTFGTYSIVNEDGWYCFLEDGPRYKGFEWSWSDMSVDTIDTAKAAAQADFDRRILSALRPSRPEEWRPGGTVDFTPAGVVYNPPSYEEAKAVKALVLVPREPTQAMLDAGYYPAVQRRGAKSVWQVMVAAALDNDKEQRND